MGRGAQGQTQQLTDQQLAQTNALNQQLLGQQQSLGGQLSSQYQNILNNPGYSPATQAAITGQSQGALASAFDSLQQAANNRVAQTGNSGRLCGPDRRFGSPESAARSECGATQSGDVRQHGAAAAKHGAARALRALRYRHQPAGQNAGHSLATFERARKCVAPFGILHLDGLEPRKHARRLAVFVPVSEAANPSLSAAGAKTCFRRHGR